VLYSSVPSGMNSESSGPENRHRVELLFQTSLASRHRSPPWLTSHVRNLASLEMTYTNCRSDVARPRFEEKRLDRRITTYPTHVYNARVAHTTSLPHRVKHCVMPFIPDYRANRASVSLHSDELRGYLSVPRFYLPHSAQCRPIISNNYAEIN